MVRSALQASLRALWPRVTSPGWRERELVERIRGSASRLRAARDGELARRMGALRDRVRAGASVVENDIVEAAFALICEAARRTFSIELYDVQLLGGIALARGAVAEMLTGEGKTFATLLPAACHALGGQGVHVMTVNTYLAHRDHDLLAPALRLLGLTVGLVDTDVPPDGKRAAYACDVTFGPGYEFGFDYLRDQSAVIARRAPRPGESLRARRRGDAGESPAPMQRGQAVAIVDEADSVLIDEATTPLVLAAGGREPSPRADVYQTARRAAARLEPGHHYVWQESAATLQLTRSGHERLAADPGTVPRHGLERPWAIYVQQALRAEKFYTRDVHYVVVDCEVRLVDQYTGRIFTDRSWRDGLQQAIQAKEGVTITTETQSLARITRQRYLRRYRHLCGMTGTAQGAVRELRDVYGLNVVVIPPHRPCRRVTLPTRVFATRAAKENAIVDQIVRLRARRQPVLVGTAAIETSQRIARQLSERGIPCQLLNGKQDAEEAQVVAAAGQAGAVTVATNMAGRGTDIKLGPGVPELGGLHVIASEPQESSRVDRQLVGRGGRQGDPGSCQLFTSADDELFRRHAPALPRRVRHRAGENGEVPGGDSLEPAIRKLQRRFERTLAHRRRLMFQHDDWLESVLRDLS